MKKCFFKGWYFKCCANDKTIAFIPAYHINNNKKTASLQIITDDKAFNIPFENLEYTEKPLFISLRNCIFSEKGIDLNIKNSDLNIFGKIHFTNLTPIKYDIMGPFAILPFMQCKHSVFSMSHKIDGEISINGKKFSFKNDNGYIEGDCGRSFPKKYIWTQCCFKNGSIMLSVADIPMFGFHFTEIIGIVMVNGKQYRIATYLGASLKQAMKNTVTVKQGEYTLIAKLIKNNSHPLNAPINGNMSRTIHESVSCKAYYCFLYKDKILCEFTSNRASFEFEYN